jgi:hypothetical protein
MIHRKEGSIFIEADELALQRFMGLVSLRIDLEIELKDGFKEIIIGSKDKLKEWELTKP